MKVNQPAPSKSEKSQPVATKQRPAAPAPTRGSAPRRESGPRDRARLGREGTASAGSTPDFSNWGNLHRNQQGDHVRDLQESLNRQGAHLKEDGKFGRQTDQAVRNFQQRQGLSQDGVAGAQTQEKLRRGLTLPEGRFLSEGSQGNKVRGLQHLLNRHGAGVEKDGQFGNQTQEAVRKFQESHQLKVDGIVGPETLKALNARPKGQPAPQAQTPTTPVKPEVKPQPAPQAQAPTPPVKPEVKPQPAPQAQAPSPPVKPEVKPQPAPQAQAPTPPVKPEVKPQPAPQAQTPPVKPEVKPQPAPQAQTPAQPPKPEPKPADFGLSPSQLSSLEKSGHLETLRGLPAKAQERIQGLSPEARQKFAKGLAGSTFGVSHREAFVKGTAMGMDTFSIMEDKINEAVQEGRMTRREADSQRQDLRVMRALTPRQRDAIAQMLLNQRGA